MSSERKSEFKVSFGSDAWTIVYEDSSGSWIVTFDVDLDSLDEAPKPQRLILNPSVVARGTGTASASAVAKAEAILSNVQTFLKSKGYEVTVYSV